MTTRRRWIWVAATLVIVSAIAGILLWLSWDPEYGEMKARYDKVRVGTHLEEAEAMVGLQPAPEPSKGAGYAAPEWLAEENAQSGPWDSEDNY